VNPKLRRLREHSFQDVVAVDDPWLRLALIQAAYSVNRDKIRDSWIDYFGPTHMSQVMKREKEGERKLATKILKTFHRVYARHGAYDHLPEGQRALLLGRLGVAIGRVLLAKEGKEYSVPELQHVAWAFEQELRKDMPKDVKEGLDEHMGVTKPSAEAGPSALAEVAKKEIAPVMIVYDERGDAKNSQQAAGPKSAPSAVEIPMTDLGRDNDFDTEQKNCPIRKYALGASDAVLYLEAR